MKKSLISCAYQDEKALVSHTTCGKIRGFAPDENTRAWYGVPYAAPPVGALRWRPPVAPRPWNGIRDTVDYGDQAAQDPFYKPHGLGGMSEDCLYLNITAPKDADHSPVMVWFHGGAFVALTGNMPSCNNSAALPAKGIIVVTVNHRLGPFGYLAHPLLSAESDYGGSGNYGQMDLMAALQWVQDNIAAFGGDPGNVTLFGQSGGGAKALSLMASPLAVGLFHKVICQSGMVASSCGFMNGNDLAAAEVRGLDLTRRLGVETLAQMRAVPWKTIVDSDIEAYGQKIGTYRPNIDGYYQHMSILKAIRNGLSSDVPLIAGATTSDRVLEGELMSGLIEQMPLRAAYSKAPQYVYRFDHVPAGWRTLGIKAYHGIDLAYLFNYPAGFIDHFRFGLTGLSAHQLGGKHIDGSDVSDDAIMASTGYNDEDVALTDALITMWANFARNGDPGIPDVVFWQPYNSQASQTDTNYLHIGMPFQLRKGLATGFCL